MEKRTPQRTPYFLLSELKSEVERITDGMTFLKPRKELNEPAEYIKMQVYEQALPIPEKDEKENMPRDTIDFVASDEEDPIYHCPWAVVKLSVGNIPGANADQTATASICFGVYNDSYDNNGHREILNLIQRVYERFARDPVLGSGFTCECNFEWAVQAEDTYPYYFGAIGMDFRFLGIRREDKFT